MHWTQAVQLLAGFTLKDDHLNFLASLKVIAPLIKLMADDSKVSYLLLFLSFLAVSFFVDLVVRVCGCRK